MSKHWSELVNTLQRYPYNIHDVLVRWKMPIQGWLLATTDGSSNKNSVRILMVLVYEIKEEFSYM